MPTDTSGRVTMGVNDVDHLSQIADQASHAMDSLEAKHVAGGGTTDISTEVQTLRDYHDATASIVKAAMSARDQESKGDPNQGQLSTEDRTKAVDEANKKNATKA